MITIRVYDRTLTFIGLVTSATDASFTPQLGKVGEGVGSFKVQVGSPELLRWPTILDYKNIVVMHDSRTDEWFPWQLDKKNRVLVSDGEKAGEVFTINGRGCLGLLSDAVVLSERWSVEGSARGTTRSTSFASKEGTWYNPTEWVAPDGFWWRHDNTVRARQPRGFPDQLSHWIWYGSASTERPVEYCYFRTELHVLVEAHVSIFCSADDAYDMWLDGEKVLKGTSWRRFERYDTVLPVGTHVVGIRGYNGVAGPGNRGGLLFAAWTSDPSSLKLLTRLRMSDEDNFATRDPALPVPGWDPGDILKTFWQEGVDRGVNTAFAQLYCDWTDDADSAGVAWDDDDRVSREWSLGVKVLEVARKLAEGGACDVRVIWDEADPVHKLKLQVFKQLGVDRTIAANNDSGRPVEFRETLNIKEATYDGDSSGSKTALIMKTDLGWIEVVSSVYGAVRTEEYVSVGGTEELDQAVALAEAAFEKVGPPQESVETSAVPVTGLMPFKDYSVGDWVLAPNAEGAPHKTRVVAIVFGEGPDGEVVYTPQFNMLPTNKIVRATQWLRTMADGAVNGRLANVSVASIPSGARPNMANSFEVPFTYAGDLTVSTSEIYVPSHDALLNELFATLTDAGSTDTVVDYLKNGVVVDSLTIPAGDTEASLIVDDLFEGGVDRLQMAISTAGTGAQGLSAQARFV